MSQILCSKFLFSSSHGHPREHPLEMEFHQTLWKTLIKYICEAVQNSQN